MLFALHFLPLTFISFKVWDRNNTLENLSGWETSCAMLIDDEFHIAHAKEAALQRGMDVEYLYGTARNRGETEPAMVEILKGMKKVSKMQISGQFCALETSNQIEVLQHCLGSSILVSLSICFALHRITETLPHF